MFGLENYNPEQPKTEDEASTSRHIKTLSDLFKARKASDMNNIDKLMDLTLYQRRQDVIAGTMAIPVLIQKYPWLSKSGEEVLKEYQRISNSDIMKQLQDFLNSFACYLASFYVYNIEYPMGLTNTMAFYERVCMKITHKQKQAKVNKKVVGLISDLNNLNKQMPKKSKKSKK